MSTMSKKLGMLAVFLIVMAALVFLSVMSEPASSAVAAIPTPVGAQAGGGDWVMVTYSSSWDDEYDTVTSTSKHAPAYTAADITWAADISGTMWLTCTIQFSNDDSGWANGVQLFGVTASETEITQTELFGRYHRIRCVEAAAAYDTNTFTMTLLGKLMN